MTHATYYGRDLIIYNEVRSDNCFANGKSGRFVNPAAMNVSIADAYPTDTWSQIYAVIANANIIINAEDIEGDQDEIDHIKGQAYAIRALAHFDLLKLLVSTLRILLVNLEFRISLNTRVKTFFLQETQ